MTSRSLLLVLCLLLAACRHADAPANKDVGSTAPARSNLPLPKAEATLVTTILDSSVRFTAAQSGKERTNARNQRANAIRKALGNARTFNGWIGRIADVSSTAEGEAFVRIDVPDTKISIGTWEDPASDAHDHTLIAHASPLYQRLSDLGIGTLVTVRGRFVASKQDFIAESSLNEGGTMDTPTFIAHIDDIRAYKTK